MYAGEGGILDAVCNFVCVTLELFYTVYTEISESRNLRLNCLQNLKVVTIEK